MNLANLLKLGSSTLGSIIVTANNPLNILAYKVSKTFENTFIFTTPNINIDINIYYYLLGNNFTLGISFLGVEGSAPYIEEFYLLGNDFVLGQSFLGILYINT